MLSGLSLLAALALSPAHAQDANDDLDISIEGYYRARGYTFYNLYDGQEDPGRYMLQRLRVQPTFSYKDKAKFSFMSDLLDDSVWGDNQDLASTALFANDPSATGIDGQQRPAFVLKRAWLELKVPVGVVRVGRQPSHWGLGLLANSGDGFDDTFGENYQGNNFDRVLFATRPVAIAQAAMGRDDSGFPLFLGFAVDRLVEDPLTQYYGYQCEADLTDGVDDDYDARCDVNGDGVSDLDHGYSDATREEGDRSESWWLDNNDDVYEMVYLAIFRGEELPWLGGGDLTLGAYAINRIQVETNSNVWIYDAYVRLLARGIYAEAEGLTIRGQSAAIALPGVINLDPDADPLTKDVNIFGYVARAGYKHPRFSAVLEHGYASGDDNVSDAVFTGRPLHPDYNVGLIMYEEVMSRVTQLSWTEAADGLWSGGGVYNSRYIFPTATVSPIDNWELVGGFLMAWPDRPDGARVLCAEGDEVDGEALDCALYEATSSNLGWEIDGAIKGRFSDDHVLFTLEAGYAQISDRIPLAAVGLNEDGKFFTLQSRVAYVF